MRSGRAVGLLAVVAAGLLLLALGRVWVQVSGDADLLLGAPREQVTGAVLARGAVACAYLALASVVALVATRGWARVVLGVVVVASAVGALAVVLPLTRSGSLGRRALEHVAGCDASGCPGRVPHAASAGWPWLAVAAALLLLAAGVLTVLHGRRWGALGSSYEAPGAPREEPRTEKGVWDALDRGEDPTA